MKTKYYLLVLLFIPIGIIAQTNPQETPEYIKNGAFTKDHNSEKKKAYAYPDIEEKDIVWSRTIWREIDMRQKFNHHLYFPSIESREDLNPNSMSLIDVVMEELYKQASYEQQTGIIDQCYNCYGKRFPPQPTVKSPNALSNDSCMLCNGSGKLRLDCFNTGEQIPGKEFDWGTRDWQEILDIGIKRRVKRYLKQEKDFTLDSFLLPYNQQNMDLVANGPKKGRELQSDGRILLPRGKVNFNRTQVMKWRVKEEWFFDKKRSKMNVRIIGLCPVIPEYENPNSGLDVKDFELFWIYYPDWRDIFARTIVVNLTKNDAQKRSYLEILEKRMFGSRITMESNIMNREISDYMIGLDALLESERIKEEIFNIEHDMWEY